MTMFPETPVSRPYFTTFLTTFWLFDDLFDSPLTAKPLTIEAAISHRLINRLKKRFTASSLIPLWQFKGIEACWDDCEATPFSLNDFSERAQGDSSRSFWLFSPKNLVSRPYFTTLLIYFWCFDVWGVWEVVMVLQPPPIIPYHVSPSIC